MQLKLIADMLKLTGDVSQHELVRLYTFCVACAAVKRFHAARAAALRGNFLKSAAAYLNHVLSSSHAADSVFLHDPFEQLKALVTCTEAIYLAGITNPQSGDYVLAAGQLRGDSLIMALAIYVTGIQCLTHCLL